MRVAIAAVLFAAVPAASLASGPATELRANVAIALTVAPTCSMLANIASRGIAATCAGAVASHVYVRPAGSACTAGCEVPATATARGFDAQAPVRRETRPGAPGPIEVFVEF